MQCGALAGLLGLKEKREIQVKFGVSLTVMDQPHRLLVLTNIRALKWGKLVAGYIGTPWTTLSSVRLKLFQNKKFIKNILPRRLGGTVS